KPCCCFNRAEMGTRSSTPASEKRTSSASRSLLKGWDCNTCLAASMEMDMFRDSWGTGSGRLVPVAMDAFGGAFHGADPAVLRLNHAVPGNHPACTVTRAAWCRPRGGGAGIMPGVPSACSAALVPGSCRERCRVGLHLPRLGRGAAEGLLECAAEAALALEAQRLGDLADRQLRAAHQRPSALEPQLRGVFARCLAENLAMQPHQVPRRVVGAARQHGEVGPAVVVDFNQ